MNLSKSGKLLVWLSSLLALMFHLSLLGKDSSLDVYVEEIQKAPAVEPLQLVGQVFAPNVFKVTAGVSEQIVWLVEPGQVVAKGERLAEFDSNSLILTHQEQENIVQKETIQKNYYESELKRLAALEKKKLVAPEEVNKLKVKVDLYDSQIKIAQSRLRLIEDKLSKVIITSPINGVVTQRLHLQGEQVSQGDVLAIVQGSEDLRMRIKVPLSYYSKLKKQSQVDIQALKLSKDINGYAESYRAPIVAVIPNTNLDSKSFEVQLALTGTRWQVGEMYKVSVPMNSKEGALTVSRDAILYRQDGDYVLKVDSENRTQFVPVEIFGGSGSHVQLKGDLLEGDRVLISNMETIRSGQKVKVLR